jgi:hypothetical protein
MANEIESTKREDLPTPFLEPLSTLVPVTILIPEVYEKVVGVFPKDRKFLTLTVLNIIFMKLSPYLSNILLGFSDISSTFTKITV